MGEAENRVDHDAAGADPPLTVQLLADLQAGLLDDDTATRVRRQVREDPQAAETLRALNQVRHDVAAVGADAASAPDPPPAVTARIAAALKSADSARPRSAAIAAHLARPPLRPRRVIGAVIGLCAALAATGLGTAALMRLPGPAPSAPETLNLITVSTPPMSIPMSDTQIRGLLDRNPDFGPLSDPARRASCISGLGYPASTKVLGARPIEINTRPGVVLVLPGDTADSLAVFAVALNCSAADTGLLASTQLPRA